VIVYPFGTGTLPLPLTIKSRKTLHGTRNTGQVIDLYGFPNFWELVNTFGKNEPMFTPIFLKLALYSNLYTKKIKKIFLKGGK
jgi:hypothetical protein